MEGIDEEEETGAWRGEVQGWRPSKVKPEYLIILTNRLGSWPALEAGVIHVLYQENLGSSTPGQV